MEPIVKITEHFKPKMEARDKKSAFINIGSVAGENIGPMNADYSCSKAFDNAFSNA